MDKVFACLGNPVIYADAYNRVIAERHDGPILSQTWRTCVEQSSYEGMDSDPLYLDMLETQFSNNKIHRHVIDGNLTNCICTISMHDTVLGLFGVLEQNRRLAAEDMTVMQTAANIIAIKTFEMPSYVTNAFQPIITDLADGRLASPYELERALRIKNWKPAPFNRVVVIVMEDTPPLRSRNNYILRNLQREPASRKIARIGNELLVLEEYNKKHISLAKQDITKLINQHRLPAGVSNEFSRLLDLRKYYEQAQKAIRYNDKSESTISYYRDFMLQDFLKEIQNSVDYRSYCHPGVMLLHEYDKEHHSDLCETLFLYLSCNRSTARVSDRLGIHKNTVLNRLNRITDMINFNVDDENEAFHAMLTLRLVGQGK
jgi:hypothetical protein